MSVTVTFTSPKEIVNELMEFKGSSACSMECTVLVKHNKKSRISGATWEDIFGQEVYKTYTEYGNLNLSYENCVNAQRVREASEGDIVEKFVANSLKWGKWVKENLIIEYNDNYYLRYYSGMNANSGKGEAIYHYDSGKELTDVEIEALQGFLPPQKKEGEDAHTEKEIQNMISILAMEKIRKNVPISQAEKKQLMKSWKDSKHIKDLKKRFSLKILTLKDLYDYLLVGKYTSVNNNKMGHTMSHLH